MKRYGFMKRIGLKNSHLLTSSDGGGGDGSKGKQPGSRSSSITTANQLQRYVATT